MTITEFRTDHPEYNDVGDVELGNKLYDKFYSDIPKQEFMSKFIGMTQENGINEIEQSGAEGRGLSPSVNPPDMTISQQVPPTFGQSVRKAMGPNIAIGKALGGAATSAAKDIGYSMTLGHIREAMRGESPKPGPLSLRTLSPTLGSLYNMGGASRKVSDVAAGAIHDVTNLSLLAPVAKGLTKGGVGLLKKLPGASPVLQEQAIAAARKAPSLIKSELPAPLWKQFQQSGFPSVKVDNVVKAIQDSRDLLDKSANPPKAVLNFLNRIEKRIAVNKGSLLLDQLDADRKSIGEFVRQYEKKGGSLQHISDQIYGAFYKDLGATKALGGEAGTAATGYTAAINASKKAFAKDDLAQIIERNIYARKGDELISINIGKIRDSLRKSDTGQHIEKSIDPKEWADIQNLMEGLAKVPNLPPPSGMQFGSGRFINMAGFAFGLAKIMGFDYGTASTIGSIAGASPYIVSRALMTKPGRAFLRKAMQANFKMTIPEGAALAQAVKTGAQEISGPEE